MIFQFAQTNLQLRRQMLDAAYPADAIERLDEAYDCAVPMFSGQYRGNGKPFINHLVGTASILASRRAPPDTLIAALLHAAYMCGDLGVRPGGRRSRRRRERVRELIGSAAEELVATYDSIDWQPEGIARLRRDYATLEDKLREATLMRLANVYEDFMDGGMGGALTGKSGMYLSRALREDIVDLARLADWPQLAQQLALVFDEFADSDMASTCPPRNNGLSRLRLPPSARRKLVPTAQGWCNRRLRRLGARVERQRGV